MGMNNEDQATSMAQEKEWIKEVHGIYAGLIGVGVVMMQPFMYQGEYIGMAAVICVLSFAFSIPTLAALLLLNFSEEFRHHFSSSKTVGLVRGVAQLAAGVGFVAAFWHINSIAGMIAVFGCVIGMVVYTVGYSALNRKRSNG